MRDRLKVIVPLAIIIPIFPPVFAWAYPLIVATILVSVIVQPKPRTRHDGINPKN